MPRERPKDPGPPENHPGSRYGTAAEDRPDLAPETEPLHPRKAPPGGTVTGDDLPEHRGEDPGDVKRRPGKIGRSPR